MQKTSQQDSFINPDQLRVGLFVHLDLSWTKHPFSFSSFKIENQQQIITIQNLGLKQIRYTSSKSDCYLVEAPPVSRSVIEAEVSIQNKVDKKVTEGGEPKLESKSGNELHRKSEESQQTVERKGAQEIEQKARQEVDQDVSNICVEKQQIIDRINDLDGKMLACEREFTVALQAIKMVCENVTSHPEMVSKQANELIGKLVGSAMIEPEIAIHLMIDHKSGSDHCTHAMNVVILSMMIAKEMSFSVEQMKLVGLGALFHDIGFMDLPIQLKEKADPLTPKEEEVMHQHCKHAVNICNKLQLPYESILIVWQHHERIDGSGYPERLRDKKISPLASIVAVADAFDEICNPINLKQSLTPHESLSIIYAQQRTRFDGKTLTALVRCLGVYPPGTIVLLSNSIIGMVVAVNSKRPLKPVVLVYDPAVANDETILIDLQQETAVNITKTLNSNQLSPEAIEFLAVGKRTSYFFKGVS